MILKLKRSTYEILQILRISLTNKTHLRNQGNRIQVYIEEKEDILHIYNLEIRKNIVEHKISSDKGRLVSNTSHRRECEATLDEYEASARKGLPEDTVINANLSKLRIYTFNTFLYNDT